MATIYIGRVVEIMIFRQPRLATPQASGTREAPLMMLLPLWGLIAISIFFGIFGSETLSIAASGAERLLDGRLIDAVTAIAAETAVEAGSGEVSQ